MQGIQLLVVMTTIGLMARQTNKWTVIRQQTLMLGIAHRPFDTVLCLSRALGEPHRVCQLLQEAQQYPDTA